MTDFETWLLDDGYERLFRIWIYNSEEKSWDVECNYVFIKEAIELPDKDILLGLQFIFSLENMEKENPDIEYWRLSQLRLAYYPDDIKEENWN